MKPTLYTLLLFVVALSASAEQQTLHQEDRERYNQYFEQAGAEFGVPADILRGMSFAETRWTHMKWDENDTVSSCTGMPRVYGVMGLWDNDFFGHTLREAATLINKDPQELKESPLQNIRGAAALLKKYYTELPKPETFNADAIESWQNAIAKFSGFPQEDISQRRGLEVYSVLSTGYAKDRIFIQQRDVNLDAIQQIVLKAEQKAENTKGNQQMDNALNQPDYPLAKWNAAYSGNYSTTLIQQKFVVIHDVEGSYLGCISWFKNPSAVVSAHYVLNSHPNAPSGKQPTGGPDAPVGEITQMVEEKYRAYHVGCWNSYMVGIEHEGYYDVSGWYTQECYESSARLVSYLCDKYNIPKDRNHIIPHSQWQNTEWKNWVNSTGQGFDPACNTHVDPGQYWNWTAFMNLVTAGDTVKPEILASSPANAKPVPTYKVVTVQFNTAMDISSTNAAFSITPSISGTKSWNGDNTILTFKPSANFAWNTSYTVTIDTSAKNISLKKSLGGEPFIFSFTTVALDTVGPKILWSYPYDGAIDVPVKPEVMLSLDDAVQTSSLSATLKFVDANNSNVSMPGAKNEIVDDQSYISFLPALKPNSSYTIKLFPGMKDYYNNLSKDTVLIHFTTETLEFTSAGIPIDIFESNGRGWVQPGESPLTQGVDTSVTKFTFVAAKKYSGTNSGNLSYKFLNASGGNIVLSATSMPTVDSYSSLGVWVYGDMSNNRLKMVFSPDDQTFDYGKVHWRGWKFLPLALNQVTGSDKKFIRFQLVQEENGAQQGSLYFDDMQLNAVTTSVTPFFAQIPRTIVLEQNFPNPFNPATVIQFSSPFSGVITLEIYDILGRKITTLLNEFKQAGTYRITADLKDFPSGVYYYTLKSNNFSSTKKMVLVK
jgi:N-acetyl-anhydromuramyl-L-alanine amidase AmpD